MKLNVVHRFKSLQQGDLGDVDVSQFAILTGPNGSGKSNLLEAIQSGSVVYDDLGAIPAQMIRRFGLGELTVPNEGAVQGASYKEPWAALYNSIQSWLQQPHVLQMQPGEKEGWIQTQILEQRHLTQPVLHRLVAAIGKPLWEVTITDLQKNGPLIGGVRDPFTASIAEVFLTYNARLVRHESDQWRFEKKGIGPEPATDEEFFARFGPAPWELLDETLQIVGLPYQFDPPPPDTEQANYEVTLRGHSADPIHPIDLSSGERVLLSVALSLYTGTKLNDVIELPRILLLDEADASLHPSMVKSLLTVIQDVFVAEFGVRVILATHSPSTVALAPEESLYVMSSSAPRLAKATTDQALKMLTVGMSSLSVKIENRRQVFVESEYDQAVYQALYPLLKGHIKNDRSAEFIAVGRRSVGGGCDMVIRLVAELRAAGNDTIYGIIDRDHRDQMPEYVYCVDDRYTIENLVFDPLLLGTILLREQIVSPEELGLATGTRNFELYDTHAKSIVSAVAKRLGYSGRPKPVQYLGGFTVDVPEEFLERNGHAHEEHVLTIFPELNRFKQNLKTEILKRAGGDVVEIIPLSAKTLLDSVLGD